jgi:alkylated DNA nucleotide flippase Atl1
MNQQIARQTRWGRPEIYARAADLASRIAQIWPGPAAGSAEPADPVWEVVTRALAEIPAGAWTTYGDIAALIGSHPVAIGTRLATQPAPNAHRVLTASGQVSDGFHWLDGRADDPRTMLESEGVIFDGRGRADPQQRLTVEDLAQLAAVTIGEPPESLPEPHDEGDCLNRFDEQLTAHQAPATVDAVGIVAEAWITMGGWVWWGRGSETSCFLVAREGPRRSDSIWPVVLYPTGKCEVVFQYLASRPPFDDIQLRQELRERLNKIPGVDLPAAKLELRPGFPVEILADEQARDVFIDTLAWFYQEANAIKDVS